MKGHIITISRLHLINGLVYFIAEKGTTTFKDLDVHREETVKGKVEKGSYRIKELARFAQSLGLVSIHGKEVQITEMGKEYFRHTDTETWRLSEKQKALIKEYLLERPERNSEVFAITTLHKLVSSGLEEVELRETFCKEIGKDADWKSITTREENLLFGLNYLHELGLIPTIPYTEGRSKSVVRNTSERRVWWVNQGTTFEEEKEGGYIWAPLKDKSGHARYSYTCLQEMKEGDVVLHNAGNTIRYVSRVVGQPRRQGRPSASKYMKWETEGTLVELEYHELSPQVSINSLSEVISRIKIDRGPFEKAGRVKFGYAFFFTPEALRRIQNATQETDWPMFSVFDTDDIQTSKNVWIFQANPSHFDARGAVKSLHEMAWTVNQHKDAIKAGDRVYIWESGRKGGIIAIGRIKTNPAVIPIPESEQQFIKAAKDMFNPKMRARLTIDSVLKEPLSRTRLKENSILKDLDIIRTPRGTNYPVTRDQAEALEKILRLESALVSRDKSPKRLSMNFMEYVDNEGFVYDPLLIENFLLSLKVKPFIILTGNSGTGKTKIAQLYAKYLSMKYDTESDPILRTEVKVGKSTNHKGWSFKKSDLFERYPILSDFEGSFDIEVDGVGGRGRLEIQPRLFYEPSSKEIHNHLTDLAKKDPDSRVVLGINLTPPTSDIYEIIPVGANWTENRHIVGFKNVINGEYHKTKALEIILRARVPENGIRPFFLILDEMNLSHVERYFADFLSMMESREKMSLHDDEACRDPPHEINFPQNLFVVGTVNVDETTYMFSPKVLDRANTIEFQTKNAEEYMSGTREGKTRPRKTGLTFLENPLNDGLKDGDLRKASIGDLEAQFKGVTTENPEGAQQFWRILSIEMGRFQACLKEAGFDFGFRIVNEVARFMFVAWVYEGRPKPSWDTWERYFDAQIKQKMLPKIHGSHKVLGDTISQLFRFCFKNLENHDELKKNPREVEIEFIRSNASYKSSALKLREMDKVLHNQRYVSFTQ